MACDWHKSVQGCQIEIEQSLMFYVQMPQYSNMVCQIWGVGLKIQGSALQSCCSLQKREGRASLEKQMLVSSEAHSVESVAFT